MKNSSITPELLETVERYYNGSMAQKERLSFKEQLQNDPDFKLLVEDIHTTLLGIETQALKEQLDVFHKDIPENDPAETTTPKVRNLNFSRIAIAIAIIMALGMFWMFRSSSNDKLYIEYFTPDPGLPTTMSASDNFEFYDAMVNYKQGDYTLALSKWGKLEHKKPNNDTINYFLGVAHLAAKNPEKAVPYLHKTTTNLHSVFLEDAYYYMGLAYLKMDNIQEATEAFKKSKSEKSLEVLKRLD